MTVEIADQSAQFDTSARPNNQNRDQFRLGLAVHFSGKAVSKSMGVAVTTPPATSGPSAPDPSVVDPLKPSGLLKQRRPWLIVRHDRLGTLSAVPADLDRQRPLVNGEYVCLDRKPMWGPPQNPEVYTSCSGHIDELLRKWGWVS
jgi:hypothetical protein